MIARDVYGAAEAITGSTEKSIKNTLGDNSIDTLECCT